MAGKRVVGGDEARRRVAEVVMTIRDSNNTLVGVNTVYIQDLLQADNPYYFYRVLFVPGIAEASVYAVMSGKRPANS